MTISGRLWPFLHKTVIFSLKKFEYLKISPKFDEPQSQFYNIEFLMHFPIHRIMSHVSLRVLSTGDFEELWWFQWKLVKITFPGQFWRFLHKTIMFSLKKFKHLNFSPKFDEYQSSVRSILSFLCIILYTGLSAMSR